MSASGDSQLTFDELLLREVARLLPDVDVVRFRDGRPTARQGNEVVTGQLLTKAAQTAARHLVGAWSAVFAERAHPRSLRVAWSALGLPDFVHTQVTARLAATEDRAAAERHGPDVPDPDAAAKRLRRRGWSTAIRSKSSDGFNLLGRLDGFRLDVIVQEDADVRAVRVTGPAIAAGEAAPRIAEAEAREIPWPSSR